jgi:NAD(P)-dependent dehydrogenase (short-subunit alcohol dehydrogenase family)
MDAKGGAMSKSQPARRILVSGGTSGIGRACAERLSAAGDRVWVLGQSEASVARVRSELGLAGGTACDVAESHAVYAAVADAAGEMEALDGIFVNAGIDGQGLPAVDLDHAAFRRVLDVNVIGAFLVAQAGLRHLSRPGAIVFNASMNGLRPEAHFLDYNASKAAVVSMAKSFALELSGSGVAVTALCPGYFPTRMTAQYLSDETTREEILSRVPAGRLGELPELAAIVDFLLSRDAAYMTGSVISVDGGACI